MAVRPSKPGPAAQKRAGKADLASAGERRQVTALCYDLVQSTDLMRRLDLEDYQDLMTAFHAAAAEVVTRNRGVVADTYGDGGMAIFASPTDPKDTASHAVEAGLALIEACQKRGAGGMRATIPLEVRVGIATSMAIIAQVPPGQSGLTPEKVTGIAPALAARLQTVARPNSVVVSQLTRQLAGRAFSFRFLGKQTLKGFEPESAWQALRHKLQLDRFFAFGKLRARIVGRDREFAHGLACWERAASGQGNVLLIEGEAGIGKSRLLHELRKAARPTRRRLLLFQCAPGGVHETLHPVLQALTQNAGAAGRKVTTARVEALFRRQGIADREVTSLFSFLLGADDADDSGLKGASPEAMREKVVQAAEQCLSQLAADGPLLIAIEDAHWIDPTSYMILAALARRVQKYPVLLIVTSRKFDPQARPGNGATSHIPLSALDRESTRIALEQSWPDAARLLPRDLIEPIHDLTNGNPLFVEELSQWMSENEGAVETLTRGATLARGEALESILSARLANLGPAQDIARYAAVAGRDVDYSLLCSILPDMDAVTILESLKVLGDAGILLRNRIPGYPSYSFRHALIQETIYNSLLRKTRQVVHGRIFHIVTENRDLASWIGSSALADHAERAGLVDEAIDAYVEAGKESSAHSALAEAKQLLDRALTLVETADPQEHDRLKLAVIAALCPVLTGLEGKKSPRASELYAEGVMLARRQRPEDQPRLFPVYWGWWFTASDFAGHRERAQIILADLKDVADDEVQLQARHCLWAIDYNLGFHESCIKAVDGGLSHYDTGRGAENFTLFGGHDAKVCGLGQRGLSLWLTGQGRRAVESVAQSCAWAETISHLGSIAHAYDIAAMLHRYRRDFAALGAIMARMRDLAARHELPALTAKTMIFNGWSLGVVSDPAAGRALMEEGLALQARVDTPEDLPVYNEMLAEVLGLAGEPEAGLALVAEAVAAVEASGHRYWVAQLHHRRLRLLAQSGAAPALMVEAAENALRVAREQGAITLLINTYRAVEALGFSAELVARYRPLVAEAERQLEPDSVLFANPEPLPHG
jgi:predicted ATPase/class 3 adenylate cyclase